MSVPHQPRAGMPRTSGLFDRPPPVSTNSYGTWNSTMNGAYNAGADTLRRSFSGLGTMHPEHHDGPPPGVLPWRRSGAPQDALQWHPDHRTSPSVSQWHPDHRSGAPQDALQWHPDHRTSPSVSQWHPDHRSGSLPWLAEGQSSKDAIYRNTDPSTVSPHHKRAGTTAGFDCPCGTPHCMYAPKTSARFEGCPKPIFQS